MDAAHQLHREEPLPVLFEQLAQAGQVGVLDVRQRAKLVLEAQDGVGLDGAQRLQRHARVALAIEGLVDDAHAPRADPTDDEEAIGPGELVRLRLDLCDHDLPRPARDCRVGEATSIRVVARGRRPAAQRKATRVHAVERACAEATP